MIVLCFLMSIPLKMMAETVTIHFVDEDLWSDNGGKICAYVYKGSSYLIKDWPGTECTDIQTVGGTKVATWTLNLGDDVTASDVGIVFNNGNGSQYPAKDVKWEVKNGLYYYKDGTTSTTPPSEGGGSGTGGGGSTTVDWNTVTTNRLKGHVYTQGFYLAGNFFTFDTEGINYDDAVFKFQQQKDINESARTPYDVYMVEIPASLTAKAQVMYVDANGEKTGIFGPGAANKIINKDFPATGQSTEWANPTTGQSTEWAGITPNESTNLFDKTKNYWDFFSRNVSESEYSDG